MAIAFIAAKLIVRDLVAAVRLHRSGTLGGRQAGILAAKELSAGSGLAAGIGRYGRPSILTRFVELSPAKAPRPSGETWPGLRIDDIDAALRQSVARRKDG